MSELDVLRGGPEPGAAEGALLLFHGRGGRAGEMLELGRAIAPPGTALLAPQAPTGSWYPASFLAPAAANEPDRSRNLAALESIVEALVGDGVPADRVALAGFSQGACVALEIAGRTPRRWSAVVALTGGRLGPPGTSWDEEGDYRGTPVLISAGDPDPHVPWWRVEETARWFEALGARVQTLHLPGRPHTVIPEELAQARALLGARAAEGGAG